MYKQKKFTNFWRHSDRRFSVQRNGDRSGSHVDPVSSSSSRINYSSSYLMSLGKTMPKQRLLEELWHTLGSLGIRKPFRSRRKRRSSAGVGYPVVRPTGIPTVPLRVDVTGEMLPRGANKAPDARLDIRARSFWAREQSPFFDARVCHPNADSYKSLTTEQIYKLHENGKKRLYSSRVLEVERGTFTP